MMSAIAGALDVTLEKRGAYRLGYGRRPGVRDVGRSVIVVAAAAALLTIAVLMAVTLLHTR